MIYTVRIRMLVIDDDDVKQDVMRNWVTYIHIRDEDQS